MSISLHGSAGLDELLAPQDKQALEDAINACLGGSRSSQAVTIHRDLQPTSPPCSVQIHVNVVHGVMPPPNAQKPLTMPAVEEALLTVVDAARNDRRGQRGESIPVYNKNHRPDDDDHEPPPACELDIST